MQTVKMERIIFLGAFFLFSLLATQNVSGMHHHLSFEEIAQTADLIFIGTAFEKSSWINEQQTMAYTDILFDNITIVHAHSKSWQKDSEMIRLTYPGGNLNGRYITFTGTPYFQIGHRYLIFTLDDGKYYSNPVIGGSQGLYEVVTDEMTGESFILTAARKSVLGYDSEGLKIGSREIKEMKGGAVYIPKPLKKTDVETPTCNDPRSFATKSHFETADGPPISLEAFLNCIQNEALMRPVTKKAIRSEDTGYFYRSDGTKIKLSSMNRLDSKHGHTDQSLPQEKDSSHPFQVGCKNPNGIVGDPLSFCGFRLNSTILHIKMEQVDESWWDFAINNYAMWTWNQFVDVYRFWKDDGYWDWGNAVNEFCGWVDNTTLNNELGFNWPPDALGLTYLSYSGIGCTRIIESDVLWNAHKNYTDDRNIAINDPSIILLLPVCMHELGHTWGYMDGYDGPLGTWGYPEEHYNYDQPSVMHSYVFPGIVEDGIGIHWPDAHLFRDCNVDENHQILGIEDIGVESYYAQNGLKNSTTDKLVYVTGEPITFQNVTVENMGYWSLSDVNLQFYFSTDRSISSGDYQVGSPFNFPSFPGEDITVDNYHTYVPYNIPPGVYYVGAIVTVNGFQDDDFTPNNFTYFNETICIEECGCQITLTAPLPGNNWCVGETHDITWTTQGCVFFVDIQYSTNGGVDSVKS